MKYNVVNTKNVHSTQRFDPSFHLSDAITLREKVKNVPFEKVSIADATENVFLGNIFSRIFVKDAEHGIPYLAASDTVLANLDTGRYLSKKQASILSYLMLKKDWIVVTCSGTIGNVTYTNSSFKNHIATHDLIRIVPNDEKILRGYLYAFLASKYGYNQLTQSQFGGVVKHINAEHVRNIKVPCFAEFFQEGVNDLIQEAARLREESSKILCEARKLLKNEAGLRDLTDEDYNYFGPRTYDRKVSCFVKNIKDLGSLSFHAFNYSERVQVNIIDEVRKGKHIRLFDALDDKKLWSSSGIEVNEVKEGHGIMLINQSDIFDQIVRGKWVVKKKKYAKDLLQEGEILIAKIGTLGEGESFCRAVYVGEDLKGQLVSSAFFRMKSNKSVPSGYLFAWLSSDYGFRLIRASHYGTKQYYPNPSFLYEYPVPIINLEKMLEIDKMVKDAHTKLHLSNTKELLAIHLVEQEIEKWNKH